MRNFINTMADETGTVRITQFECEKDFMKALSVSIFASTLIFSVVSLATGGIDCVSNTKDIKFSVSATTASAFGSPVVSLDGSIDFKGEPLIQDITSAELKKSNLVGYWSMGKGTDMAFYFEDGTEDFGGTVTALLSIKKTIAEGVQTGKISIEKNISSVSGRNIKKKFVAAVTCTVE